MSDRVPCLVPFCKRTTRLAPIALKHGDQAEWICGKHWPAIPRQLRLTLYRARRLKRGRLEGLVWAKCKQIACDRAMGI